MRPEERGKFCFDCRKKVHDLSSMTEDEARGFLRANACNDICISFEHDEDGTLHFQPAPRPAPVVPLSRLRRPRKVAAAVAGVGMAAALAACTPHGDGSVVRHEAEASVFQSQTLIIPHGEASEATPVPTPPPTIVDEPCDPPTPVISPKRHIMKGKRPRTAGRPVLRTKGDMAAVDPLAL